MALNLGGFVNPVQDFKGLNEAASTVERGQALQYRLGQQQAARNATTSKFLTNYLDPKDYLTGTAYDPAIVQGIQGLLQQGESLAAKGAPVSDILMALGPQVNKLNQYSTTAKLVQQNIKNSLGKVKPEEGYDMEALEDEAKKQAFFDQNGKLKDISSIDPTTDWVAQATKVNPQGVTTSAGLDTLVDKLPMKESPQDVTTTYAGRSKTEKYDTRSPFYMSLQRDANGKVKTDQNGNPLGLHVTSSDMTGDDGKPIIDPTTNQPYQAMDKDNYHAIMSHFHGIADFVRGQVMKHFQDAGAQNVPPEGSPQWDMMARHVLGQELSSRDRSYFKVINQQKETASAVKMELGNNPADLDALAKYESAVKLKGDYSIYDPKSQKNVKTNAVQTVGEIFNNNPAFTQGDEQDITLADGTKRSAIDVTSSFPGGRLASGKGAQDKYESIYYDPNKRELLLGYVPKSAPKGTGMSYEVIPENKAPQFMARIAAANNVDPAKVGTILSQQGYQNAKFSNAASAGELPARIAAEHSANVSTAIKNNDWKSLKGLQTKDGAVDEISERTKYSWLPGVDRYAVFVKDAQGNQQKVFTTSDKSELEKYLKSGSNSAPATDVESIKKKHNISY